MLIQARRALPILDGRQQVQGLHEQVEIVRDGAGIPHIYAAGPDDLFFAQGYVTAQDRLWQMEMNRRTAEGRLSEVFGPISLDADRLFRKMGLARAAALEEAALSPEVRRLLQAYCDGVNAYVASRNGVLPIEYTLLAVGFEPWKPVDSLAWAKLMAWQLSGNWSSELLRAALVGKLGPLKAAALMPSVPPGIVPQVDSEVDYSGLGASLLRLSDRVGGHLRPASDGLGSNNWVVAGSRSTTGKPLLANDPHLGLQMPSIWYEVHLVGGVYDVAGLSLPGTPGVIIGHNQRIAWGATNVGADVQDLFVERRNPDNPSQFLFEGRWEEARVVRETIGVRGWPQPLQLDVPYTRHGPVLNADEPDEQPLALRWTGLGATTLAESVLRLNAAQEWQEFRAALERFAVPSQNFVYADTDGHIGYQLPGLIPRRSKGDGLLPVPGWTGEYEWQGFVPFADLVSIYDPPDGFLVTANNRVVPDGYDYLITHEWAPSFRADRIRALLLAKPRLSVEDFQTFQQDVHSPLAESLVPLILDAIGAAERAGRGAPDARLQMATAQLASWDYELRPDAAAPTLFNVFYNRLVRNTFADELGPQLFRYYSGSARNHVLALQAALSDPGNGWFDNVSTPRVESRDEVVWLSLREATEALANRFGDQVADWRWGGLHTTTFAHWLGGLPLLSNLFNRGPYPRGGDGSTVNVSGYSFLAPYREAHNPSCRFVADLADWERTVVVVPTGQSGQVLSPHYDDQLPLWLSGQYVPFVYGRSSVDERSAARLELVPSR